MSQASHATDYHLGFLTVVELTATSFCGGLLVVSIKGRPVEFHCTAPVVPNRAQEILYGQALKPFLVVDQIGVALTDRVKSPLAVLVIDRTELSDLSSMISTPMGLIHHGGTEATDREDASSRPATRPRVAAGGDAHLEINNLPIELFFDRPEQKQLAEDQLRRFTELLPLSEPFERIRNAIQEAHKVAA